MSSLDLAGVIGTWIGAGVGLIALIGIVGPLLIWRATRTEHFKAVTAVGPDASGFITRGIKLWPNGRLFRRVRAPMIQQRPNFASYNLAWDLSRIPDRVSDAGWIQFGTLLKAYHITFSTGSRIELQRGKFYLPVHRVWILSIGLLGRYAEREDKGQINKRKRVMLDIDEGGGPMYDDYSERRPMLHGITGAMEASLVDLGRDEKDVVVAYRKLEKSALSFVPENLPFSSIFMLSIGCIPITPHLFFSVTEVESVESDGDGDGDWSDSPPPRPPRNSFFWGKKQSKKKTASAPLKSKRSAAEIQTYKLEPVTDRANALVEIGRSFDVEKVTILSLVPFRPSSAQSTSLEELVGQSFVPAASQWVRLEDTRNSTRSWDARKSTEKYVMRSDAQLMALALFRLPWHPEGYILGADKRDHSFQLLRGCSKYFRPTLTHMVDRIDHLGLASAQVVELKKLATYLSRRFNESKAPQRAKIHQMFQLERLLRAIGHHIERVNELIGVMMITNSEFINLVRESAERFDQAPATSVEASLRSGAIKVPGAFGILLEFPVSIDEIYAGETPLDQVVMVPFPMVLIASLRACLKSAMLGDCFESEPLLGQVLGWNDVVYLS